ncbi:heat-inducible transcriptional repressor HrcA [Aliicoccus persicus]|uniref:Heat-inducible transcription repressor HrcA n=1 Tax=Aliicoccus persicus TaxID=930138 RepID=A0A662Z1N2_9STAP|nr:heat-inducible transcriptional repressor HrcA [Aliicoccus persicus]SEV85247.1 heat-inducible transcription repressor HrcA [Aliicoccus persicus]
MLSERLELILMSIVDDFLNHMTPLSSNYLIETYDLDVSPATVRNEMAKLENLGLLNKPHTSAGRVPTREAVRFYVKRLNQQFKDSQDTLESNEQLGETMTKLLNTGDMQQVANYISGITKQLTQVFLLNQDDDIRGLYVTYLTPKLVLAVIVLSSKKVLKIPVECNIELSLGDIEQYTSYINQMVINKPLTDLPKIINEMKVPKVLFTLKNNLYNALENHLASLTITNGSAGFDHIIESMVGDVDTLQNLYSDVQNQRLEKLIDANNDGVNVFFGEEIDEKYRSISIISTNFSFDDHAGNLMIIGPELMSYKHIIRLLYDIKNQSVERSSSSG